MSEGAELGVAVVAAPIALAVLAAVGVVIAGVATAKLVGEMISAAEMEPRLRSLYRERCDALGLELLRQRGYVLATEQRQLRATAGALGPDANRALDVRSAPLSGALTPLSDNDRAGRMLTPAPVLRRPAADSLPQPLRTGPRLTETSASLGGMAPPLHATAAPATPSPALRAATAALARSQAGLDLIERDAFLAPVAQRWHTQPLQQARTLVQQAHEHFAAGRLDDATKLASTSEGLLAAAAADSLHRIAVGQREVVSASFSRALDSLGYRIARAGDTRTTALWATKGETAIALVVEDGGPARLDMAGFDGIACRVESERVLSAVRQQGIDIRRVHSAVHGRREGGTLITAARRTRAFAENRARAVLEAAAALRSTGQMDAAGQTASPVHLRGTTVRAGAGASAGDDVRRRTLLWMQQYAPQVLG